MLTEQDWNQVFLGIYELLPNLSARPKKHFLPHPFLPFPPLVIFRISPPLHVSCESYVAVDESTGQIGSDEPGLVFLMGFIYHCIRHLLLFICPSYMLATHCSIVPVPEVE